MMTTEIITLGLATLDLAMSALQTVQYQIQAMTNYADIFMAPGVFALNLVLTIFKVPQGQLSNGVYTLIAFALAGIGWAKGIQYVKELIKSSLSRW